MILWLKINIINQIKNLKLTNWVDDVSQFKDRSLMMWLNEKRVYLTLYI